MWAGWAVHRSVGGLLLGLIGGRWPVRAEWPDAVHGEGGRLGQWEPRNIDALPGTDIIEGIEVEVGVVTLEKGLALGELELETLCVTAGGEGPAVSVLLVAGGACCCACGAARMFRVALQDKKQYQSLEIAVGVARRDLP